MSAVRPVPVPRNRLPTLAEVLRRSTRPPVDLYCYYLFLQREGSEDTLDFWLDVQQHENLCRAYFKDLRKSGRNVKEDWPRFHKYALSRGSIYSGVAGIKRGEEGGVGEEDHARWGVEESPTSGTFDHEKGPLSPRDGSPHTAVNPDLLLADKERYHGLRTPSPTTAAAYAISPTLKSLYPHDDEEGRPASRSARNSTPAQPFIPRDAAINRTDLIASAERIYSRYLMPGADKEVYLPPTLRIHEFPLSSSNLPSVGHADYDAEADAQARVPDMFHPQKEYVYRAMEQDTFPRFLRAKAFGNLTPISALVRLGVGLMALWAGLATGFSFIFLDSTPKVRRLWVILPFTVAIMNLLAHSYDLDPIFVFMGLSETTPFHTIGIREPYVRKLLFGRALWITLLTAILVAILTVIFWAVPGHRL